VVANRESLHSRARFHNYAGALVPEYNRPGHRDRSVSDGQVAVTDTAGGEFYQYLALAWSFDFEPLDDGRAGGVTADDGFGLHLPASMPSWRAAFNCCEIRFRCAKQNARCSPDATT
jgi:hypothetical protein